MVTFQSMPLSGIIKTKRVFKTRHFSRWMRKTELTDAALCEAVREMSQGLIDADLGGDELEALQELAAQLLVRTHEELEIAIADGALKEICYEH